MKGFEAQQVYKDCCKLRALTMEAQHCMTKADRIVYGNELKAASGNLVRYFVLAWGAYTKRLDRIDDFIGRLIWQNGMNSYLGQCKHCNAYGEMRNLLDLIEPHWWEFIHFNEERRCLQANPGYTFREQQNAKYHIKFKTKKHHDKTRKREAAPSA